MTCHLVGTGRLVAVIVAVGALWFASPLPVSADATATASAAIYTPSDGARFIAWNGTNCYVMMTAMPVRVDITGAAPGSQWNAFWTEELYYTTSLGAGKTLVDSDDAGSCPATTDANGRWHHFAHLNDSCHGLLNGGPTLAIGGWSVTAKASLTATPIGGGTGIGGSSEQTHSIEVVKPQ